MSAISPYSKVNPLEEISKSVKLGHIKFKGLGAGTRHDRYQEITQPSISSIPNPKFV